MRLQGVSESINVVSNEKTTEATTRRRPYYCSCCQRCPNNLARPYTPLSHCTYASRRVGIITVSDGKQWSHSPGQQPYQYECHSLLPVALLLLHNIHACRQGRPLTCGGFFTLRRRRLPPLRKPSIQPSQSHQETLQGRSKNESTRGRDRAVVDAAASVTTLADATGRCGEPSPPP